MGEIEKVQSEESWKTVQAIVRANLEKFIPVVWNHAICSVTNFEDYIEEYRKEIIRECLAEYEKVK